MVEIRRTWPHQLLFWLTIGLLIFIPLYPKIPLWQPVPDYIVRIRLEDLFVTGVTLVWLFQILKKKITFRTPLTKLILAYTVVGLLSIVCAFFITPSIPFLHDHIAKTVLHWLRYIEYFLLFFFAFAVTTSQQKAKIFLSAVAVTILLATIYGVGQRYWQWPVYSTMRSEFSSGIPLELMSLNARVQSTFAGHYDFALFLSMTLPLILSWLYVAKDKRTKVFLSLTLVAGTWSIIASALRSGFVAYVVAMVCVTLGCAWFFHSNLKDRLKWGSSRLLIVLFMIVGMSFLFGQNLRQLLYQAIGQTTPVIDQYEIPVPKDKTLVEDELENETSEGDEGARALSECARQHEISLCIRLDSLWPQAINGFMHNPLLGSGYGSLNKTSFLDLPEADGTDNNYLRILGETGILGFVTFFLILFVAARSSLAALRHAKTSNSFTTALLIGYLASMFALLLNAMLLDVFVASKVAFVWWGVTGVILGLISLDSSSHHTGESS